MIKTITRLQTCSAQEEDPREIKTQDEGKLRAQAEDKHKTKPIILTNEKEREIYSAVAEKTE
jgi:hypothetical protein